MRTVRLLLTLYFLIFLLGGGGHAQSPVSVDPSLLGPLRWRSIGPANTGGRIDDFAVARVAGQPDAVYVAAASGGVFKSTNQGTSWTPIFDRVDAMMSIGAIASAPSNAAVVWVGTGEANNRQSSSWGDGVYKSIDGGATWTAAGLRDTRHIGRIVIHPSNPDIVYVAAGGHLWGPNSERGVFRTVDGGRTWTKTLYVDDNTGATDLVMDPQDPQTLFAATYQRQRKAWGFNGGGPGSGIFRSRDGGATWTRLSNGLPQGDKGRIGLDVFRADPRVIFAVVEAAGRESGVYRSADRGDTWQAWSTLNPRPMYFSQIRADPKDPLRVYLLGSNRGFYISNDGGKTFADVFSTIHSEDHALWIDPDDTNHLIIGGDGGVSISWDRGQSWLFRDNLPVGQFYEISADMQDPYVICGGLQDNGHWCVPSATRTRTGISNHDGFNIGSGDGFYARLDPADSRTAIIESQDGRANRVNLSTLERQAIAPLPPSRLKPGERERWNWNTPIVMSTFDPRTLYMGSHMVFKSTDRGATWKAISPDLTAAIDRESLQAIRKLGAKRDVLLEPVAIDMKQRRLDFRSEIMEPFAAFKSAQIRFGLADYTHAEVDTTTGLPNTTFKNKAYEGRVELAQQPVGNLTGSVGFQVSRSNFSAVGEEVVTPQTLTNSRALFVLESYKLNPALTLQFGGRYENQSIKVGEVDPLLPAYPGYAATTGEKRTDHGFSLSTGLVWYPATDYSVGLSVAYSQRLPVAQELFSNGPHGGTNAYEVGSSGLDRENSVGVDLTVRKRAGFVTGTIGAFVNRFSNFVFEQRDATRYFDEDSGAFLPYPVPPGDGFLPIYQFVARDAVFCGGEADLMLHLVENETHHLHLDLSSDYVHAQQTTDDEPLPRIPPLRVGAGLRYERGRWTAGVNVRHAFRQDRVAAEETETAGYTLVGADLSYRLPIGRSEWELFARGTNLKDEAARVSTSFLKDMAPLPGRSVTAGMRVNF